MSPEFLASKDLRQGCTYAPTLFKFYLDKYNDLQLTNNDCYYFLLFADQVLVANDICTYMMFVAHSERSKIILEIGTRKQY